MGAKPRYVLEPVVGWEAICLVFNIIILGSWQFLKTAFLSFWRGRRTKLSCIDPPVQLIDSSIGTHCYIKVMGAKYHYVEAGSKTGTLVVILGDAPGEGAGAGAEWALLSTRLAAQGLRVVALDVRGAGGSEPGTRAELSPPRAVEELYVLLEALGASTKNPAVVIGHGIGGLLVWYLVHSHESIISRFAVIGAPHPNLYWQHPPAHFCNDLLYFIQWPRLPEWRLAGGAGSSCAAARWATLRSRDWRGALHYVRGAAWWRVHHHATVSPPALLVGDANDAGALVASGAFCARPTLRMVPRAHPGDVALHALLMQFIEDNEEKRPVVDKDVRSSIVGRMLGAVAGRGRDLSAAVQRALPLTPSVTA